MSAAGVLSQRTAPPARRCRARRQVCGSAKVGLRELHAVHHIPGMHVGLLQDDFDSALTMYFCCRGSASMMAFLLWGKLMPP